ncbi:MAG TPA: flavin reductase family protein [Steroidobacteraceae bacterium]|nr:flavin reductase family protein [Steroidobacteraceae bacterium]
MRDSIRSVQLMQALSLGVYVIGVAGVAGVAGAAGDAHAPEVNAFTASSVMPVSFDPVLIATCVGHDHASFPLLRSAREFTVNVLGADQLEVARHFGTTSAHRTDKLAGIRWRPARGGAPILLDALAYFDCVLEATMPAADHELIIGRVRSGEVLRPDAAPLTYAATGNMDGALELYARIAASPGT